MTFKTIAPLACLSLLAASPLPAQKADIVVSARTTLRTIENQYTGNDRLEHARTMFHSLLPTGMTLNDARSTLVRSGAHCHAKTASAETDCNYYSFEGIDDHLRDVVWTVRLDAPDGKLADVNVDRESIGS